MIIENVNNKTRRLAAEAIECPALTLQRVHDVHRSNRLALRVLRVRDGVADDVLEKHLQTF